MHLKKLFVNLNKLKIKRENKTNLVMYNGTKITTVGSIYLKCSRNGKKYYIIFLIFKENVSAILGYRDCEKCGFIKIMENDVMKIHETSRYNIDICSEFGDVFNGRGKLEINTEYMLTRK